MNGLHEFRAAIRHLLTAKGRHGIHSPYVYHLLDVVFVQLMNNRLINRIEATREKWKKSDRVFQVEDLGAGSRKHSGTERRLRDIARTALSSEHQAEALFQLVHFLQPSIILELGTSLGLSAGYMHAACPNAQLITIEGSSEIADFARENMDLWGGRTVEVITGNFDEVLPRLLPQLKKIDFVNLDGNHRYEAVVNYHHLLANCMNNHGVILVDDIHWSPGMTQAWEEIRRDERVGISIDFFHFGLLVFRTDMEKQHFICRLPIA